MENNKNSVLLTVLGVCTLLVALVGASFAYFTATGKTTEQNIQTGTLAVQSVLSETEQSNIKPTKFVEGTGTGNADDNADIAKFTFTVTGTGTNVTDATYSIHLLGAAATIKTDADKGGVLGDIEYALYKGDAKTGTLVKTDSFSNITTETVIGSDYALSSTTNDVYTLYVYINETEKNQDNLQTVTISASMRASAQTPAPTTTPAA